MANPVPLTSPDGTVYAYACGVCHHVASPGSRGVIYDAEDVARFAAEGLRYAEWCCACRDCGARVGVSELWCSICQAARDERTKVVVAAHDEQDRKREAANAAKLAGSNADAAKLLVNLMSDISEECYCAGWLSDCEYTLWGLKDKPESTWGMGVVTTFDCTELRRLSAECGGWWIFDSEAGGNVFLTLAEWEPRYAEPETPEAAAGGRAPTARAARLLSPP